MTTNDSTYAARLARLEEAGTGDTVTVPDGWEPSDVTAGTLRNLEPGDRFENDGGDDGMPWKLDQGGVTRCGRRWYTSRNLARAGLDVVAAAPAGPRPSALRLRALPSGFVCELDPPRGFVNAQDRPRALPEGFKAHRLEKSGARRFDVTGGPDGGPLEDHVLYPHTVAALGVNADDFAKPAGADDDQVAALDALPHGATLAFDEPRAFADGADRFGIPAGWRIAKLEKQGHAVNLWAAVSVNGGEERPVLLRSRHLPALGVTAADFEGGITVDDAVQARQAIEDDASPMRRTGRNGGETTPRIDYNHVHVGMSMGGARVVADRNVPRDRVFFGPADAELPADGDLEGAGFKPLGWVAGDGIALDLPPASHDPQCCGCEGCGKLCSGCSVHPGSSGDEDTGGTDRSGRVQVPLLELDARKLAGRVQVPLLDEWQLERVAALEHALRILESRTASDETETTAFGVPMRSKGRKPVGVQDMIDVAAFINDGDTGRIDEVQA